MFIPSHLTRSQEELFLDALRDARRQLRFIARLFNKNGNPLPGELLLIDGQVVVDNTSPRRTPSRSAHITIVDPDRHFPVDATDSSSGASWFSRELGLWWSIWVRGLDAWVDVPVFRGPIFEVARRGIQVDIDAQGGEAGHLPPAVFPHAFSVRKATKISDAIREIMRKRGEKRFALEHTYRGLSKDKTWGVGQSPWRAVQNLADAVDKQLYKRGDGTLRLRELPTQPAWVFTEGTDALMVDDAEERVSRANVYNLVIVRGEKTIKDDIKKRTTLSARSLAGATSIAVVSAADFQAGRRIEIGGTTADPEVRTIGSGYVSGTTVPLSSALDRGHPQGAPVLVRYRTEKVKRILGRARLTQHPLSAENLSDGKRPLVWIEDRPRIHKKKNAEDKAEKIMERKKRGLDDELSADVVPVPHLEEGDRIAIDVNGRRRTFRIRSMTIPMNIRDAMQINWFGDLDPERGQRGGLQRGGTSVEEIPTVDNGAGGGRRPRPRPDRPGRPGGPQQPGMPEKRPPPGGGGGKGKDKDKPGGGGGKPGPGKDKDRDRPGSGGGGGRDRDRPKGGGHDRDPKTKDEKGFLHSDPDKLSNKQLDKAEDRLTEQIQRADKRGQEKREERLREQRKDVRQEQRERKPDPDRKKKR